MKITSLQQLKDWNANPTKEAPYVMEWFYDWFFEELIVPGKTEEAIEARDVCIEFTMICEKMTKEDATMRVDGNLGYYNGYGAVRWGANFKKIFPHISHPILGI